MTSAATSTSALRRTSWASVIDAPRISFGRVTMVEHVVHDGPAAEVDVHLADDEGEPVHIGVKVRLRHLDCPQQLGAAALHEAEISWRDSRGR